MLWDAVNHHDGRHCNRRASRAYAESSRGAARSATANEQSHDQTTANARCKDGKFYPRIGRMHGDICHRGLARESAADRVELPRFHVRKNH